MNIVSICVLGVFAAISSIALRKYSPETSSLMLISCAVMIIVMYLPTVDVIFNSMRTLTEKSTINSDYINILIKSLGICYITQISVNICKENGSMSVASQLEIVGKLLILLPAIPIFNDIIEIVNNFI